MTSLNTGKDGVAVHQARKSEGGAGWGGKGEKRLPPRPIKYPGRKEELRFKYIKLSVWDLWECGRGFQVVCQ